MKRLIAWCLALTLGMAVFGQESTKKPSPATPPAPKSPAAAQPAPLTHYMGREIAQTMHWAGARWLTREEREKEEDCATLVKMLKVKPGDTACDLGCGNGFYTLKLSAIVGEKGKVIAEDIQPEMLQMLKARAADAGVHNVEPVLGTLTDPRLPESSCDLILMVDVYHELSNPEEMLTAIRKALKPHGRLALAEFRLEDPNVPIKPLHRMSKKQIMKEFTANHLKLVDQFDGLPWQHLMFFEKETSDPAAAEHK